MDEYIYSLDFFHEFHYFYLSNLDDEYRSTLFVSGMEALRAQLFNLIKLLELVVENLVNTLLFAPFKIVTHLFNS